MGFEQSWRWFGSNDPISLKEIKQTGATGVVTALHHIPSGEIWSTDEIIKRKNIIEAEGLRWTVAESLPVHENIKKRKNNYRILIENYKQSIRNLGKSCINTVCYNFMPVLDWSRTNLNVTYKDGSITTGFQFKVFAAFDLFILKRKNASADYTPEQIQSAKEFFNSIDEEGRQRLTHTILLGLPGSLETYTLEEFRAALTEYNSISEQKLRDNLIFFIKEIIPVAEEAGVFMAIHPDDPPFNLLGLPRIVSNKNDIEQILKASESYNNGLTLCTGSLGAGFKNDLVKITEEFSSRINFVHLRNVWRNEDGDFLEENHLEGEIDMYGVIKVLLLEQKKRKDEGREDYRMPMRPDHGHLMISDLNRKGIYPGYSLFGRMRGLAELRGLELGIKRSLGI